MKTERRHELQHNDLAQLLTQYHTQWKGYLQWIFGVALFAVVVWMALTWMNHSRQRQLRAGWTEYVVAAKARDVDGLRQVAARFPRTSAAARSLYMAGTLGLQTGAGRLLFDRAEGMELLDQARKDFEAALAAPSPDEYLPPQSRLGLAQVFEATNQLDKAKEQYEQLLSAHPESSFARMARQRLDFIQRPDTIAFSDWFTRQHIERPQSVGTSSSSPQIPSIHDDLPITSDFMLPDAGALERAAPGTDLGPLIPPEAGQAATEAVDLPDSSATTPPGDGDATSAEPSAAAASEEEDAGETDSTNDVQPTPD